MRLVSHATVLLVAGTALALASCSRDRPTAPTTDVVAGSHRLSAQSTDSVIFGPATFTRDAGKPRTDSASFAARAGDTLTVAITSPAPQGLNATVELNGRQLYPSHDDGHADDDHRADDDRHPGDDHGGRDDHGSDDDGKMPSTIRAIARATNTLRVSMAGKPGSSLRVVVSVRVAAPPAERRVLTTIYGSSVAGSIPVGTADYALNATVRYRFSPKPGFVRMRVVVDGRLASDEGTLRMDRAHWIAATADTVITLTGTEVPLSRSLRSLLSSAKPREDWVAYQAAIEQAASAWGAEADRHLARVELATIDPAADLRRLMRLDSALAGMFGPAEAGSESVPLSARVGPSAARSGRAIRSAAGETSVGAREPTHIMLVNGILAGRPGFREDFGALRTLLRQDAAHRFPVGDVTLQNIYNPSIVSRDSAQALAQICGREMDMVFRDRSSVDGSEPGSFFLGCMAGRYTVQNDFLETLGWARSVVANVDPNSPEVNALADTMRAWQVDRGRHVLVVGHSEGSLMMQLAIQKLKNQSRFNEDSSARCIGTVSVAGVGTMNWPLSDRHARFVVAKYDVVTRLLGDLQNLREVVEDSATRHVDAVSAMLAQRAPASWFVPVYQAYSATTIHYLERYLQSEVTGPRIAEYLDQLYRTCAVGTVTVSPAAATVQLYGARGFGARWTALDGLPLTTTDSARWSVDSALASVSSTGRLLAGGTAGTAALKARVRNTIGTATVTISDDSARSSHTPPVVSVTERAGVFGPMPPGQTVCDAQYMTVSASAVAGASIASVDLFTRTTVADTVLYGQGPAPVGSEFLWRTSNCTTDGKPLPTGTDNWYRLVVTDSRGSITEIIGPRP